jgi:hypothetical protein
MPAPSLAEPTSEPTPTPDERSQEQPPDSAIHAAPAEPEPAGLAAAAPPQAQPAEPTPAPRDDRVDVPVWRRVAPDATAPGPAQPPATRPEPLLPAASADPQWPSTPQWPARPDAEPDPLGFLSARDRMAEGLWAASSREVLSTPPPAPNVPVAAVQSCVSCGLSLSANARFCRRCGARQG